MQSQSQASSQASSSEFESSDGGFTSGGEGSSQPSQSSSSQIVRKRKRKRMIKYDPPRLVFSACICYIAMMLVRCPVTIGDVQKWIQGQEFPYMLAFKILPKEMLDRMDNKYRRVFVPRVSFYFSVFLPPVFPFLTGEQILWTVLLISVGEDRHHHRYTNFICI